MSDTAHFLADKPGCLTVEATPRGVAVSLTQPDPNLGIDYDIELTHLIGRDDLPRLIEYLSALAPPPK